MACNCTGACRLYGSCGGRPVDFRGPLFMLTAPVVEVGTARSRFLEQAGWFERMGNEPARVASLKAAERAG